MAAPKSSEKETAIRKIRPVRENVPRQRPKRPAGVIVDQHMTVLEFQGHTGPYLELQAGKPSFNLLTMVRPGLRHGLFRGLQELKRHRKLVRLQGLSVEVDGHARKVDVEISELKPDHAGSISYQVLFKAANEVLTLPRLRQDPGRERLRSRLRYLEQCQRHFETSKRYLETIIEESQRAFEELQAASEDRQDNVERLETAHAEMEAINVELEAANLELDRANERLKLSLREERQRLEEKLWQAQKLESLGVMAGGIAHDFNNLLLGVLGNASMLLDQLPPESPLRPIAKEIEYAGERAAELVNHMLAFAGKGKFVLERCNVSALVKELAGLLKSAVSKGVALEYRFLEDLPEIEADVTQIRQIIMNLIINASDAMLEERGIIRISTGVIKADRKYLAKNLLDGDLPEGRYVCLEVADNGCGMDQQTREKIFDPFFTTKRAGRGLGLAAVLGIVQAHHGAVRVESEPRAGTKFSVLFPACEGRLLREPPLQPDGNAASPVHDLGKAVVLVVDDEISVRRLAKTMLEKAGLKVLLAETGEEALKLCKDEMQAIDIALLDLTLPGMDGMETLGEMRKVRPHLRVILSSGYIENETNSHLPGEDLPEFIQKPYRSSQLLDKVREVITS